MASLLDTMGPQILGFYGRDIHCFVLGWRLVGVSMGPHLFVVMILVTGTSINRSWDSRYSSMMNVVTDANIPVQIAHVTDVQELLWC